MRPLVALARSAANFPLQLLLPALLLLALGAAGCDNTCVGFASNSSTGTIVVKVVDQKPACAAGAINGTVRVHWNGSGLAAARSATAGGAHLFVTLRGIEAASGVDPDPGSPEWRELAPQLARLPRQVDLLAEAGADCAADVLGEASVPAGVYREIRLRLGPNRMGADEPRPSENRCAVAAWNCLVAADGVARSLALDAAAPELLVGPPAIAGGFLSVLPGAAADLAIEFKPRLSVILPERDGVRLVPGFAVSLRSPCPPLGESEP